MIRPQAEIDAEVAELRNLQKQASQVVAGLLEACIEIISGASEGMTVYASLWRNGGGDKPLSQGLKTMGVVSWELGDPVPEVKEKQT